MATTFTPPNFHEDQPSALETGLATQIGARNPMSALGMLIPEMQRRQDAQADYHDYMAGINQQQAATLQSNQRLGALKEYSGLMQHAIPGSLDSARQMFGDMIPAANPQLDAAIQQRANSADVANLGKGNEGGIVPGASNTPQGFSVGDPQNVSAARIRAGGELGAAKIRANQDSKMKVEYPLDPTNIGGMASGGKITMAGPDATNFVREHPPGSIEGTINIPPAAKNQALAKLHDANIDAWNDVVKGGGKIVQSNDPNARGGVEFLGASGKRYH